MTDADLLRRIADAGYQIADPTQPNYAGRDRVASVLGIHRDQARTFLRRHKGVSGGSGQAGKVDNLTPREEHQLKRENRELRRKLEQALTGQEDDARYQQFIGELASRRVAIPEWTKRPRGIEKHEVIPSVTFSDWHFDEVVNPAQVQHKNAYNRGIAEKRLRNFFDNTVKVATQYFNGFRYPGITMVMAGDQLSGNIHEELRNTNADVILGSVLHWVGPIAAGIRNLADAFGQVFVPVVVGNHGRLTQKPTYKTRVRDNFDWILARLIERELSGDKRIKFAIAEGSKIIYSLYSTRYIATHGDECKGGSGITGMITPLMLADARQRRSFEYDLWVLGHWHTLMPLPTIRANGSGKGWDEFAIGNNFSFQEPLQDFWLTDPKHKVIASMPIHVRDDNEPWMKEKAQAEDVFRVMEAA